MHVLVRTVRPLEEQKTISTSSRNTVRIITRECSAGSVTRYNVNLFPSQPSKFTVPFSCSPQGYYKTNAWTPCLECENAVAGPGSMNLWIIVAMILMISAFRHIFVATFGLHAWHEVTRRLDLIREKLKILFVNVSKPPEFLLPDSRFSGSDVFVCCAVPAGGLDDRDDARDISDRISPFPQLDVFGVQS